MLTETTDLTGSKPVQESTSLAGITHEVALKTQYYTASVPIWLDLIASPSEWAASFLSDEAGEVLAVLGGVVLVFALPEPSSAPTTSKSPAASVELLTELIGQIGRVVNEGLGGWEWDGVRLAVGVGSADVDTEEWDELCAEAGMEFVRLGGSQPVKNEFGGTSCGVPVSLFPFLHSLLLRLSFVTPPLFSSPPLRHLIS